MTGYPDLREAFSKASARLYNRGLAYAREGSLERAREALTRAVYYNAENYDAYALLGLVYQERGDMGRAVACWKQSVEVCSGDHNVAVEYLRRASRSVKGRQMTEAVHHYNQALVLLRQEDQEDAALLNLKKAVRGSDKLVEARELLALVYMRRQEWDKAEELLAEAEKIDREDPELGRLKQILAGERQEAGGAVKHLEEEEAEEFDELNRTPTAGWMPSR